MDNVFYDSIDDIINVLNDRQSNTSIKEGKKSRIILDKNDSFQIDYEVEEIGNLLNNKEYSFLKTHPKEKPKVKNYDTLESKISKMYITPQATITSIINPLNPKIEKDTQRKSIITQLPNINNSTPIKPLTYNITGFLKTGTGYV